MEAVLSKMSNADRFLNAFNTIEQELYRILDLGQHRRFYELVKQASRVNPVVERYKADLMEYGDLRNAIVHTRTDGRVMAEPNDQAVEEIEQIASYLREPPKVVPLFQKEVVTMAAGDPIRKAIKFMYDRGYSQVPISSGGSVTALLTAGTVVRWLADCLEQGAFNPHETPISAVLEYTEHAQNYIFVNTATSLFDVQDMFYQYEQGGKKLEAILITENADPAEPLLGIITIWDLPLVHREI
jgi:CBS domain-containing protein